MPLVMADVSGAPGGRARENRKFIQAPPPEIWSETISGGEKVLAGKWGGLFLDYLLGRNYRRRDRDHLIPPRRMDSAVCRAEVCFGIFGAHGLSYPCPLCLPKRKGGMDDICAAVGDVAWVIGPGFAVLRSSAWARLMLTQTMTMATQAEE